MISPIIINKNDIKDLHLNKNYDQIIDEVDINDMGNYIISLTKDSWVPDCYWKAKNITDHFDRYEFWWAIFSYLVRNKIIIIEDKFGYNPMNDICLTRNTYFNTLKDILCQPISKRLIDNNYITIIENEMSGSKYKIDLSFLRGEKLKQILN